MRYRLCTRCKKHKPETEFKVNSDGAYFKRCRACLQQASKWRARKEKTNMICEYCEHLSKCELRAQHMMPVLCEVEVWDVDRYYIGQVPKHVMMEVLGLSLIHI